MNLFFASTLAIVLAAAGPISLASPSTTNAAPNGKSSGSPPAPGFDCARARSQVEHLICATPELAQLDAQLADVFLNSSGQAGLDPKALRRNEDQRLLNVRGKCTDAPCLTTAYTQRIATLKEESLKAASPSAYAETRPFPSDPLLIANIRSYVGKSCDVLLNPSSAAAAVFTPAKGFHAVIANGAYTLAFEKAASRFMFLLATGKDDATKCRITDVVVLPGPDTANALLQCKSPIDDPSATTGVGMRLVGVKKVVAYWAINTNTQVFDRLPLGVLGVEKSMKCQEPETGE